ncbi:PAC2 family protein [Intrasporangium sp. DVR]|uniref:PAC2 family protein n=1 Tax=Intrasporangium sp. DVR TaxID=3127867 RepID=UPI00313A63CC
MQDPTELFQFETDSSLSPADTHASVLVLALGGFVDAGHTQRLLTEHLLGTHESQVIASFDVDQLLDYRGRRPTMVFDRDRWESYADPSLLLHRVLDREGVPFLLLAGPEPDYQWARMVEAVMILIRALEVDLTINVHGIPMAVPHTRPLGFTSHGTNRSLLSGNETPFGTVQVPGSFASLLELRLGEAGRDALGFAVHVPHYLGQSEFADAALLGLQRVIAATGLDLDTTALAAAAGRDRDEIARQMEQSEEISAVVHALEQQYDTFLEGRRHRSLLATDLSDLPTADEIGAELEAFLKDVADDGPGPAGGAGPEPG